jgi:hypothetical protein
MIQPIEGLMRRDLTRTAGVLIGILWGVLLLGSASAQTTRPSAASVQSKAPAQATWPEMVSRVGKALQEKDMRTLESLFNPGPDIRAFGSDATQPTERLVTGTMGGQVIGVHAYIGVPTSVATDLSQDIKQASAPAVPADAAQALSFRDADSAKRANDVAASWISQVLKPAPQQLVGVIVIWPGERHDMTENRRRRPIFVLLLGDVSPSASGCVVQRIEFGDPLESVR